MELITGVDRAIEYAASILAQIPRETWVVPVSGGKDSRAVAQVALALVADGRIAPPRRAVFWTADTLQEYERFWMQAERALAELTDFSRGLGIETYSFTATPVPQNDFWVRIAGYGLVPPTPRMRWCTAKMKIEPARRILRKHGWAGAPLLLGVRKGESSRRDEVLTCDGGGECGPDALYLSLKRRASTRQQAVAPIMAWGTCAVWDWLELVAPRYGFDNSELAELYGPGRNLRYGCWPCPLVFNDNAGEYLAQSDPKVGEMVRFAGSVLRKGGAAWDPSNREMYYDLSGNLSGDGRLSLDYCHRLYDWMVGFEEKWGYPLLRGWQKGMIQAVWGWRESLSGVQAGVPGQLQLPLFVTADGEGGV